MNKIDKLLEELCPEGVEYRLFGETCEYIRGITYNKSQEAKSASDGVWKVLRANNISLSSNTLNFDDVKLVSSIVKVKESQLLYKGDILICAGSGSKEHIGKVAYISQDMEYTFGGFMAVIRCSKILNSRFLFHILTSGMFSKYLCYALNSTTINNLSAGIIKDFSIPVPPIAIQNEIVRILDTFSNLAAELQAELQARQKQYEYYRDKLLTFDKDGKCGVVQIDRLLEELCPEGVEYKPLVNVCEIKGRIGFRGYTRKDLVSENEGAVSLSPSNIKNGCLHFDHCSYVSWAKYNESPEIMANIGDVVFTKTASVGKTALIKNLPKETTINPQLVLLKNITCNSAYLAYVLQHHKFQNAVQKLTGVGSVPNVSQSALQNIKIPIPPLEVQNEIAGILDRFERLTTDLQEGLPAEIKARQQQYEYYRDRLLTFKRKTA